MCSIETKLHGSNGGLILVASLLQKPPNLGGKTIIDTYYSLYVHAGTACPENLTVIYILLSVKFAKLKILKYYVTAKFYHVYSRTVGVLHRDW